MNNTVNCKILQQVINEEVYRTDTSTLLAYDDQEKKFLFRALNSNYFVQDDNKENMELIETEEAKLMWENMPAKNVVNATAAFPQLYGGVGIDTYTNLYDD